MTMAACVAPGQTLVGFHDEYPEELRGASKELRMTAKKYGWRPGLGVRSVSEVYVHVAASDFILLAMVGEPWPKAYYSNADAHATAQQMCKWGSELEHKSSGGVLRGKDHDSAHLPAHSGAHG